MAHRLREGQIAGNFDIDNVINAAAILLQNGGHGTQWLTSCEIMGGRLLKFSGPGFLTVCGGYWVLQDNQNPRTWGCPCLPIRAERTRRKTAQGSDADPTWRARLTASQVDSQRVNKIHSTFMEPADFSPLK